MIPSDRMVIRRYKPLKYFADTLENGFRAGQAAGYEEREGQASQPAREREHQRSETSLSKTLDSGEDIDYASGTENARQSARHNYYANCWRLGTDENHGIWEDYADLCEGVAIETTYEQIEQYVAPEEDDLYMGLVRYLDYEEEYTPTMGFYTLYFFKHREMDDEQEFRVLVNRGGNPVTFLDGRETSKEMIPDNSGAIYLSADMDALINRVILAPGADEEVRVQVEETLDEYGVSAPVVPSRLTNSSTNHDTFEAELSGAANYGGNEEYLKGLFHGYVEETDWDVWSTVDVVQLNQKGNLHPRTMFIECFRYSGDPPDRTEYCQEHLNYEVRAHRYEDGEWVNTFWNDAAEETDGLNE